MIITIACSFSILINPTNGNQSETESQIITVLPNKGWQNTDIYINRNNRVIIEYMCGLWFTSAGDGGGHDASGNPNPWICADPNCHEPLHDFPKYALIGRIGESGETLKVGNFIDFRTNSNGLLFLRPNYGDSDIIIFQPEGIIQVRITIK